VNAFHEVHERERVDADREFALGAGTSLARVLLMQSGNGGFRRNYNCWVCKSGFGTFSVWISGERWSTMV